MPDRSRPRKSPCASCPYRSGVPSGIWHPDEYEKLLEYDKPVAEQPPQAFSCHQGEGDLCAGWIAYNDPRELLAVRLGVIRGDIDPCTFDYSTDVPLFESGAAAAEHGVREVEAPSDRARKVIDKLVKKRGLGVTTATRQPRGCEPQR